MAETKKRLIYAEDLFTPVDHSFLVLGGHQTGKTMAMYEQIFRERVNLAPTIDAVPVVHGEWKLWSNARREKGYERYCSVCTHRQIGMTLYCPSCGAKMDGRC